MRWFGQNKQQFSYAHEIHAHLLPGIDDGVKTMSDAVSLIRRMMKLGVIRFSITPHISFPMMPNDRNTILPLLNDLHEELKQQDIRVEIEAGAEYRIGEKLLELSENGDILPFCDQNVLIEHSFMAESVHVGSILFYLQNSGYTPVMAHPERYPFFYRDIVEKCAALRKRGCLIQVNLLSFAGFYGKEAESAARHLLKAGLIDYVGSDIHSTRYMDALEDLCFSKTGAMLNEYKFLNK